MNSSESADERFMRERQELNANLMKYAGTNIKKFFNLDMHAYEDGALDARTKELMGLVASTVLRCDDCIRYHTIKVHGLGVTGDQYQEAMNVALVVGGSITVPHLRRAFKLWDELESGKSAQAQPHAHQPPKPEDAR